VAISLNGGNARRAKDANNFKLWPALAYSKEAD
jgi:hypothetical protein